MVLCAAGCMVNGGSPPRCRMNSQQCFSLAQLNAPASFRGYNAALMEPGQEDQWHDALGRMHQGVQFLQLDRLVRCFIVSTFLLR